MRSDLAATAADQIEAQRDGGPIASPRGPLSGAVIGRLTASSKSDRSLEGRLEDADGLADDDLHLALYVCYELTYRGFRHIDPDLEWDPALIALRLRMEDAFERSLARAVPVHEGAPQTIAGELRALAAAETRPSLSRYLEREASPEQFREFMIQRSAYHLKEADPHSLAIGRITGAAKTALIEIQDDEYGAGDPTQMHAALFAEAMTAMGLDPRYGAYLDSIPGGTLALTNLMSMFGMRRRHLGALVGHLALFELTSSIPNRRYANGLRRCGFGPEATRFFDVHVEADAAHGAIAADDLAGRFVGDDPARARDVSFGARALQLLETAVGSSWVHVWRAGGSTLLGAKAA
jgi:heme oxygenase-like protein